MATKPESRQAQAEAKAPPPETKPAAEKKQDIFIRDSTYPNPEATFRIRAGRVSAIKDTCVFVLDTNTLLAPYGVGNKALAEVARVFKLLVEQKRLCVPAQVAREFADNRAKRLMEIYAEVQQKRQRPVLGRSPLLESMSSYAAVAKAEKAVEEAWKTYSAALDEVMKQMEAWNWDDPVSAMYADVFVGREVVTAITYDPQEMRTDLARRREYDIPPGYKDKGKDDEGIGDLLIWRTILHVGKTRGKDVVFVSSDAKTDWWHRSAGAALYPRFELLAEFDTATGGRSFNIVPLAEFLELFGVNKEAVDEVRKEERRPKVPPMDQSALLYEQHAAMAVAEWISQTWQGVSRVDQSIHHFPDFEVTHTDDAVTGVEVTVFGGRRGDVLRRVAQQTEQWISGSYRRRKVVLVLVVRDEQAAKDLDVPAVLPRDIQVIAGWIDEGRFVPRSASPTSTSTSS